MSATSTLDTLRAGVPPELLTRPQWVCWRLEPQPGKSKPSKVPYTPTGHKADPTDPATWASFEDCVKAFESGGYSGLGFVFTAHDPYTGVDFDECVSGGQIDPRVRDWLLELDSFSEYSQSGEGIHVIVKGKLPGKGKRKGNVEMYDQARFFALTGNRVPKTPKPINARQEALEKLHQAVFGPQAAQHTTVGVNGSQRHPQHSQWLGNDADLWAAMFAGKDGDVLRELATGNHAAYSTDHSKCDQRMVNALAFYTGGDAAEIDRLFRQTGLYRPKWDRRDYRDRTIEKAIQSTTRHYAPRQVDPVAVAAAQSLVDHTNGNGSMGSNTNGAGHPQVEGNGNGAAAASVLVPTIHKSDAGNARRLVKLFGQDIRYVYEWGKWLIWDGKRWAEDKARRIEAMAKETVIGILQEAATLPDKNERDDLWRWGILSEKQTSIAAMVRSAQSEPGITVSHDTFDNDPWLLNVRNGILDLRTGDLQPHDRQAMLTKLIDVDYDPQAACPLWLRFLDTVQAGNSEMVEFLQLATGYSLVGVTSEQCLFFLHGSGSNGKSTFIETVTALFGDYACRLSSDSLMARKDNAGVPNDIAQLPGKRLVVASETEQNRRLAESKVKDLTGSDTITARFMRQEWFDFTPTHTLWLYGNHKPVIRGTDIGIWRRVRLIPFTVTIPDTAKDSRLPEKLRAELPGILTWAVQGCLKWQQSGLTTPSTVTTATAQYRADMDTLKPFIDEECVTGTNPQTGRPYEVLFSQLYGAYEAWCKQSGEALLSKRKFGTALDERGFPPDRGTGNKPVRKGIALQAVAAAQSMAAP